jgi:hypothetical protein
MTSIPGRGFIEGELKSIETPITGTRFSSVLKTQSANQKKKKEKRLQDFVHVLLMIRDPSMHLSNLEQVYHPENGDLIGHLLYCDTANIVSQALAAKRRR